MRLYDDYPKEVEFGGKIYPLNLSFTAVLASVDVFEEEEISEQIATEIALDNLVVGEHPADYRLLKAIFELIFPKEKATGETVIDFKQDADLILSAFRQAYGIDLRRDPPHWCEFSALLKGIPSNTKLAEIIDLRQRPIPGPTKHNAKERAALIAAKARVAIKKQGGFEKSLMNLYESLKARAESG